MNFANGFLVANRMGAALFAGVYPAAAVVVSLALSLPLPACAASTRMTDPGPSGVEGADGASNDVAVDGSPGDEPALNVDASPLPSTDASAAPSSPMPDAFSASCGTCAAGQKCAPGHGGEYCVAPCPGQPCPPSGPQVPYCDAYGGVHCMAL
jgi:hypothetical protein